MLTDAEHYFYDSEAGRLHDKGNSSVERPEAECCSTNTFRKFQKLLLFMIYVVMSCSDC